jgi:hypothetical protein
MLALHRSWLRAAGLQVADDVPIEISPLLALDAEEARSRISPTRELREATFLSPND